MRKIKDEYDIKQWLESRGNANSLWRNIKSIYRRGRSTKDAVSLLTSIASSHLDKSRSCVGVFLDLAKAFYIVSISLPLRKMEGLGSEELLLGDLSTIWPIPGSVRELSNTWAIVVALGSAFHRVAY